MTSLSRPFSSLRWFYGKKKLDSEVHSEWKAFFFFFFSPQPFICQSFPRWMRPQHSPKLAVLQITKYEGNYKEPQWNILLGENSVYIFLGQSMDGEWLWAELAGAFQWLNCGSRRLFYYFLVEGLYFKWHFKNVYYIAFYNSSQAVRV